jgi:hypothetical protein
MIYSAHLVLSFRRDRLDKPAHRIYLLSDVSRQARTQEPSPHTHDGFAT